MATPALLDDEELTGWKVTIPIRYKPWLCAADEDDGRPALWNVCLDPAGWAVASNGFLLAVVPIEIQNGLAEDKDFAPALVGASFFKAAHKAAKKQQRPGLDVMVAENRALYHVGSGGIWADLAIEEYPNWRGLVPEALMASQALSVDPGQVETVMEAIGASSFRLMAGGPGKAAPFVLFGDTGESVGMVMPTIPANEELPRADLLRRVRRPAS